MAFSAIRRAAQDQAGGEAASSVAPSDVNMTSIFDLPAHPTTAAPEPLPDESGLQRTPMGRPQPTPRPSPLHRPYSHDPQTAQASYHLQPAGPRAEQQLPYPTVGAPMGIFAGHEAGPSAPPQYESHNFPPPDFRADQSPQDRGGRFPRWRGWLEKRAQERHYARMDAEAQGGSDPVAVARKKTWGPAVGDPDAVSDDDGSGSEEMPMPPPPPLHKHSFGSRFLPHLPSQPLCAAYLDLPTRSDEPAQSAWHQRMRNGRRPHSRRLRRVLLIGTMDGLYAVEFRSPSPLTPMGTMKEAETPRSADQRQSPKDLQHTRKWNGEIRAVKVWSSLGVYQLSLLSSSSARETDSETSPQAQGILLALCAPEQSNSSSFLAPLNSLGAQAGAVLESLASAVPVGFSNTPTHGPPYLPGNQASEEAPDSTPGQFGIGAGGGKSAIVPPSGQGQVKMWNLEAIVRIVQYALDGQDSVPLDLLSSDAKRAKEQNRLSVALKKVWANLGDPPSERRNRRQASGGHIEPLPQSFSSDALNADVSGRPQSPPLSHGRHQSSASQSVFDRLEPSHTGSRAGVHSASTTPPTAIDSAYMVALKLALDSVPINSLNPSSAPSQDSQLGSSPSFASLFSDEMTGSAGYSSSGKQRARDKDAQGVIFYSVYEAPSDSKGAGTWYLALVTPKTILLYEAVPRPNLNGESSTRSFRFLRELYTPFMPLAAAFVPTSSGQNASDGVSPIDAAPLGSTFTSTKLSVGAANVPLLASTGKHARHTSAHNTGFAVASTGYGTARSSSSLPIFTSDSSDLSILVSFGRRAVVIRLVDSHVREIDVQGVSSRIAGSFESAAMERRPSEMEGLQSRTSANKRKSLDATNELAVASKQWVGLSTVTATVWLRPRASPKEAAAHHSFRSASEDPITPASLTPSATTWRVSGTRLPSSLKSASRDKDLPAPPAPLGLSFERRADMDRRHGHAVRSESDLLAVRTFTDDSDDSDFEEDVSASNALHEHFRGVSLADEPVLQPSAVAPPVQHKRGTFRARKAASKVSTWDAAHNLNVSISLVSKGCATHILSSPLPADLNNPRPLAPVLVWRAAPSSVSGFSRVMAVERATSSGALPTGALSSGQSTTPTVKAPGSSTRRPSEDRRLVVSVVLSLTVIAILPGNVSMKRTTLRVAVSLPFLLAQNFELEVLPAPHPASDAKAKGVPGQEVAHQHSREAGPIVDPTLRHSLLQPSAQASLELEYPTAHLLPAPQVGGSSAAAAGAAWRPDAAAGDGGAFGWEWRGGSDYRICYIGAEV